MPANSKVGRCVRRLMQKGHSKVSAIKICQASTGQAYATGRKAKRSKSRLVKAVLG